MKYLDGSCVKVGKEYFYIKEGKSFKILTKRVLKSWAFSNVVKGDSLKDYPPMGYLGFRPGTLLENQADGKQYVIENNRRRHIQDPDAFDEYGLNKLKMILVSDRETNLHKEGEPLGG